MTKGVLLLIVCALFAQILHAKVKVDEDLNKKKSSPSINSEEDLDFWGLIPNELEGSNSLFVSETNDNSVHSPKSSKMEEFSDIKNTLTGLERLVKDIEKSIEKIELKDIPSSYRILMEVTEGEELFKEFAEDNKEDVENIIGEVRSSIDPIKDEGSLKSEESGKQQKNEDEEEKKENPEIIQKSFLKGGEVSSKEANPDEDEEHDTFSGYKSSEKLGSEVEQIENVDGQFEVPQESKQEVEERDDEEDKIHIIPDQSLHGSEYEEQIDGKQQKKTEDNEIPTEKKEAKKIEESKPPRNKDMGTVTLSGLLEFETDFDDFDQQDGKEIFIDSLSSILGVDQSSVTVTNIRRGSVIFDFEISLTIPNKASTQKILNTIKNYDSKISSAVQLGSLNIFGPVKTYDRQISTFAPVAEKESPSASLVITLVLVIFVLVIVYMGWLAHKQKKYGPESKRLSKSGKYQKAVARDDIDYESGSFISNTSMNEAKDKKVKFYNPNIEMRAGFRGKKTE